MLYLAQNDQVRPMGDSQLAFRSRFPRHRHDGEIGEGNRKQAWSDARNHAGSPINHDAQQDLQTI
jgi:hypothetical protein